MESTKQEKKDREILAEFVVNEKLRKLPETAVEKAKTLYSRPGRLHRGGIREQQAHALLDIIRQRGEIPTARSLHTGSRRR